MKKMVILTYRSQTSYLLINQLLKDYEVALIVFERRSFRRKLSLLNRRLKRLGIWRVGRQSLFLLWDRLFIVPASKEQIRQLLKDRDVSHPPHHIKTLDVPDINATEVLDAVRSAGPACGVVSGTSLLRDPLIKNVPVLLNLHVGITPRYRGVHGGFWAVYEGRPELAGVTIHQIDKGIDTGGIVAQANIRAEPSDTYRTLPVKQFLLGVPVMVEAVKKVLAGTHQTYSRTDLESKIWHSPTIGEYLEFHRRLKTVGKSHAIGLVGGVISEAVEMPSRQQE